MEQLWHLNDEVAHVPLQVEADHQCRVNPWAPVKDT